MKGCGRHYYFDPNSWTCSECGYTWIKSSPICGEQGLCPDCATKLRAEVKRLKAKYDKLEAAVNMLPDLGAVQFKEDIDRFKEKEDRVLLQRRYTYIKCSNPILGEGKTPTDALLAAYAESQKAQNSPTIDNR